MHCPHDRRQTRRGPHGRAGLRARPDHDKRLESLMRELKPQYTIVVVTHNTQQATRVSDRTAFFSVLGNRQ